MLLNNGKIGTRGITLARFFMIAALLVAESAFAANGQLDFCFGDFVGGSDCGRSGKTYFYWPDVDPASNPSGFPSARGAAVKVLATCDGGAIVVANIRAPYDLPYSGPQVIGISKRKRDGTADTAFGDPDPFVLGSRTGRTLIYVNDDSDWLAADALLGSDGSIFIAGTVWSYPSGRSDMAIWKLNPDGSTATGFGNAGLKLAQRNGLPRDQGRALVRGQNLNYPAIAGNVTDNGDIGTLGMVFFSPGDGRLCVESVCGNVIGGDVGLPTQWRMFRSGLSCGATASNVELIDVASGPYVETSPTDIHMDFAFATDWPCNGLRLAGLARFRLSFTGATPGWSYLGLLGNRFGGETVGLTDAFVRSIVYDPNRGGGWLMAGRAVNNSGGMRAGISRHTIAGIADTAFNGTGRLNFEMRNPFTPTDAGQAYIDDIAVMPDGRIIAAGGFNFSSWTVGDAMLARLNPDGSFDNSFGNYSGLSPGRMSYGHEINGVDRDNRFASLAVTPDAQLLTAGYAYATTDTGYQYLSVMRVLAVDDRIFYSGME